MIEPERRRRRLLQLPRQGRRHPRHRGGARQISTASSASSMPTPAICSSTDDDGGNGLLSRLLLQVDDRHAAGGRGFDLPGSDVHRRRRRRRTLLAVRQHVPRRRRSPSATTTRCRSTLGRPFSFQGQARTSVFVNSNGSLSFDAGDASFVATVPAFLAGPPRISPLWTDLDPTGALGNPGLVLVDTNSQARRRAFRQRQSVLLQHSELLLGRARRLGQVAIKWGPTARGAALVGMTQGAGAADPGPSNLSRARTARHRDHVRELPVQHLDARASATSICSSTRSRTSSRTQCCDVGSVAQLSGRPAWGLCAVT